ncbi:flagellar hook-basal body complex protein FliE [Lichenicoccus roseus]|uniref:Flagellar hook-basal body complex protein FliE n=1 Tax=Lichenicoccus roseus TaxID=2683649 RepID=A0A5R9J6E0_9PROT|nr:flagellar hook-basal body complex protein FliE [Lichenicoccus roseus]TLU73132.1 flagellar hook-basal body complex protein FliE [Lichenicoccus roseus]
MSGDPFSLSASSAVSAYARVQGGTSPVGVDEGDDGASADGLSSFGATLERAMHGVVESGQQADLQSAKGIAGEASITDVVTAVSRAQLALQSTVAIRDRVVQAYQDVMKMQI